MNEAVKIGDNITIKVIGYRGGQVRLGISAPRSTSVYREEVFQRIEVEKTLERGNREF
jgi:carbon storage regulator